MVVALENRSFAGLRRMFSSGKVEKTYTAVVEGSPPESGSVKFPIAHDPGNRRKMIVLKGTRSRRRGKAWPASTRFVVVSRRQGCSLVELGMDGGVMHQIRVHMSCIGHPVVGDSLYGSKMGSGMGGGFFLHASGLSFRHPVSGVRMEFHSPVPSAFGLFLSEKRRKDS
jgi:23S rRNA-/tRNA-specific pseudouridylate synthase